LWKTRWVIVHHNSWFWLTALQPFAKGLLLRVLSFGTAYSNMHNFATKPHWLELGS